MKNIITAIFLTLSLSGVSQSIKCKGGTLGTSSSNGGRIEWLPAKSLTKRWYAKVKIQDYRTGQYWYTKKYTNTDNANEFDITQDMVINLAKSVDVSFTWPAIIKNCIDSANMKVRVIVDIYREKWTIGSGWVFDLYSGGTNAIIYINMLDLKTKYICDSSVMFLHYPETINYNLSGTYTFKNSLGATVAASSQNKNYPVALDTGLHTLTFVTNIDGCRFEKTSTVQSVLPPHITKSIVPLPDTVLSSSATLTLSNYFNHNGGKLESNSIGTNYNPNLVFVPFLANTGNNILEIYSVDTTSGCETVIYDTIFVKNDPGIPSAAFIDYYNSGFHNKQIQGKWVLYPPSIYSPPGNLYVKQFYHYKELNICDGDSRKWILKDPKIGSMDLSKNLIYHWYLSHSLGIDTLGIGINKTVTIPDNDLNDKVRLIIVSENYIGTKNTFTQEIYTWKKPRMYVEPELTNCYSQNDTIKMYEQWHNFRQTDTSHIRISNLIDSSRKINLISTTNTPYGPNYSLINTSTNKYENNIYSLEYEFPYFRHKDLSFSYVESDSIIYGITGDRPSGQTDSSHVFFASLNSFIDTCVCKNIDTVVSINNPIPDYFLSYIFPSDSIVKHGDLMRYINTSSYSNTYYWDFHNGDYSYMQNANQYIYESGWHSLTLTASDTINYCYQDSVNLNIFKAETILGIEESKIILNAEVYPNPFISSFNLKINTNKSENIEVFIFAISGKLVRKIKTKTTVGENNLLINLSGLSSNQYLVKVVSESSQLNFKLIKQ